MIVRDGDTGRRIRGADVHIGRRTARSDHRGVAHLSLRRARSVAVYAAARGYSTADARLPFEKRRYQPLALYRPRLQWPMYGATPQRTQTHPAIELRPPFRVVWRRTVGLDRKSVV